MPTITDYASVSQAIADYTHRSDLYSPAGGTFYTDYFLQAAQEMINKDIFDKNLGNGISFMEAPYGPYTITGGTTPLPTGYIAPKLFKIADSGGSVNTLIPKAAAWIYDRYPIRQAMGLPAYIARDGGSFIYGPYPDSAYTVSGTFYQAASLLNGTQTTNWMTTNTPNLLFAAAMKKAMLFLRDTEGYQLWESVYQSEIQQLIDQDKGERWGSATLQIELG